MKKIVLLLVAALMALPAYASKEEKAATLMKLMNVEASLNIAYDQAIIPLACQFIMTPADETALKAEMMKAIDAESFVKILSQFWIQNYTEQELDEVLKFYQTSAGKKSIDLIPAYTKFMLTEQEKWMKKIMPKMIDLGKRIEQKYQKRSGKEAMSCLKQKGGQ